MQPDKGGQPPQAAAGAGDAMLFDFVLGMEHRQLLAVAEQSPAARQGLWQQRRRSTSKRFHSAESKNEDARGTQ